MIVPGFDYDHHESSECAALKNYEKQPLNCILHDLGIPLVPVEPSWLAGCLGCDNELWLEGTFI